MLLHNTSAANAELTLVSKSTAKIPRCNLDSGSFPANHGFLSCGAPESALILHCYPSSADIPWHVTAFHRDYRMTDPEPTPVRPRAPPTPLILPILRPFPILSQIDSRRMPAEGLFP
jgi:hypothetical protein